MNKSEIEIYSFSKSFFRCLAQLEKDLTLACKVLADGKYPETHKCECGCGSDNDIWKTLFPNGAVELLQKGEEADRQLAGACLKVAIEAVKGTQHLLVMETLISLKGSGVTKEDLFDKATEDLKKILCEKKEVVQ